MTEPEPKAAGGFTGWVDGRIKVMTVTAIGELKDDLIDGVKTVLREELSALPGQVTGAVEAMIPAEFRPAMSAELEAVLPDLLSGHLEKVVPDAVNTALGPFMGMLQQIQGVLGNLPHFPGFGLGGPERR